MYYLYEFEFAWNFLTYNFWTMSFVGFILASPSIMNFMRESTQKQESRYMNSIRSKAEVLSKRAREKSNSDGNDDENIDSKVGLTGHVNNIESNQT